MKIKMRNEIDSTDRQENGKTQRIFSEAKKRRFRQIDEIRKSTKRGKILKK